MATNTSKYGALTVPDGHVNITWSQNGADEAPLFRLDWQEEGGPPIVPPTRRGLGSRLIQHGLGNSDVQLDYLAAGVHCTLTSPLDGLSLVH